MKKYLIVGSGGALGALARYWLEGLFPMSRGGFPTGTFIINLSGSFGLGLFLTLIIERFIIRAEWRLFGATGFIGAYTTFSSFTNEILGLFRDGYALAGLFYAFSSLTGGLICVWAGYEVARFLANMAPKKSIRLENEQKSRQQAASQSGSQTGSLPAEERSEIDLN